MIMKSPVVQVLNGPALPIVRDFFNGRSDHRRVGFPFWMAVARDADNESRAGSSSVAG
jgi:hypothetical protein